jgi:hypothetical protein
MRATDPNQPSSTNVVGFSVFLSCFNKDRVDCRGYKTELGHETELIATTTFLLGSRVPRSGSFAEATLLFFAHKGAKFFISI